MWRRQRNWSETWVIPNQSNFSKKYWMFCKQLKLICYTKARKNCLTNKGIIYFKLVNRFLVEHFQMSAPLPTRSWNNSNSLYPSHPLVEQIRQSVPLPTRSWTTPTVCTPSHHHFLSLILTTSSMNVLEIPVGLSYIEKFEWMIIYGS